MCCGVLWLALHQHFAVSTLGTLQLQRNSAKLIFFVLACTSKALSALRNPLCSSITLSVSGVSFITYFLPPRSVFSQKSMFCSCLYQASCQRFVYSFCTSSLCFYLYSLTKPFIYFLVYFLRLRPSVLFVSKFTNSSSLVLCLCTSLWSLSLFQIIEQALQIIFAIPNYSIQAQYYTTLLFSQRSISRTYAFVSSFLISVALNTLNTAYSPLFCFT